MCELQEYYATSSSYTDNWEVNNKCCAFSVKYKQWYRAIIVDLKLSNEQAEVSDLHISSRDCIKNHSYSFARPSENYIKILQYILMRNNYYIFQIKIVMNLVCHRKFSRQLVVSLSKYER
jgi:hypothetical protein